MRGVNRVALILLAASVIIAPIGTVFAARSTSTNYIIDGSQLSPIAGGGTSTSFTIETGGNPISGLSTSSSFQVQQGAPLDPATATTAAATTATVVGISTPRGFSRVIVRGPEVRFITETTAEIFFETNDPVRATITYGPAGSYSFRASESEKTTVHRIYVFSLLPGRVYNYRLLLELNPNDVREEGPFFFATRPALTAVPNVSRFFATPEENEVVLIWQNPIFSGYRETIIVRNTRAFPRAVSDGTVVFRGTGETYRDTDVAGGQFYYYGAFVVSNDGRFSSGVLQSAQLGVLRPPPPEEGIVPTTPPPIPPEIVPTPETGIRQDIINIFTLLRQRVIEGYASLSDFILRLSDDARVRINSIREGLINNLGQLETGVLDTLTPEEKEAFEQILEGEFPEEFRREAVNVVTPVNLLGDEEIDWRVFADSNVLLTIPREIFLKEVQIITVAISNQAYMLTYNSESDAYEALIRSPEAKGRYQAIVQIIYTDNTFEEVERTVLVDPYGIVYEKVRRPWSWTKPWRVFFVDRVPVGDAEVTLETLSRTDEWTLWPAYLYGQFNPILTTGNGEFAFVVPAGTYRLRVEKAEYRTHESGSFEVEDQVVNIDINLKKQLSTAEKLLLYPFVIIVVGALAYFLKRAPRNGKRQKPQHI